MPFAHGRKLTQEQYAELYQSYLHARTIHEAATPAFEVWIDEYEGIEAALDFVMKEPST